MELKVYAVVLKPKPKVFKGIYFPEDYIGEYKAGYIKKEKNMCPFFVEKTNKLLISEQFKLNKRPVFVIDPVTQSALPLGKNKILNGEKISFRLETIFQKRYVKNMTERVFDMLQMIILMLAGYGIFTWVEEFIRNITA